MTAATELTEGWCWGSVRRDAHWAQVPTPNQIPTLCGECYRDAVLAGEQGGRP